VWVIRGYYALPFGFVVERETGALTQRSRREEHREHRKTEERGIQDGTTKSGFVRGEVF
jgi:hypothetical protein